MATANGTSTPPATLAVQHTTTAASDTSAIKRKREDDELQHDDAATETSRKRQQVQLDILELLRQHDTEPSFLEYDFDDVVDSPQTKKARLADPSSKTSISAKLSTAVYTTLAGLKEDAARVSKAMEAALRSKAKESEAQSGSRLSVEELKQIQRAKGYEDLIREIVDKESQYDAVHQNTGIKKEAGTTNGHVETKAGANGRVGTVLTLFGNAPTPKQLFSSMQNAPNTKREPMIKTELPVEEMSLPNGLTATKIMPAPADEKKGPTFEETFAPPYNLPALQPPKTHKRSATREPTITWEFKDPISRGSRKGGYTVQSATTGEWLGYGGIDSQDAVSPREKRKQRDRALSSGAETGKEPPNKLSLEEQQAREEEALFRRAYSSFAPSQDNTKSVIPAEAKSMVWWHKVGEQRFNEVFAIDPALLDPEPGIPAKGPLEDNSQMITGPGDFEKVIEGLDGDLLVDGPAEVSSKAEVESVLLEISVLLETLASHQKIRNATLQSSSISSRTPVSPSPVLAARMGKPDEPSGDEIATYEALRRELAYLVLKLPPYAVAKLDCGDQLAELGVSRLIRIQTKDVKGTMEEDQVARLAKHNALATAQGIATLTRSTSSSAGQHYSATAQRTPAIGQAANTRYGQSSQFTRPPTATPSQPQYQRSTSNQSSQYATPSATAPRPAYAQTQPNQYTRPGATAQQSYAQPNGQQQQYYQQQQRPQTSQTPANYGGFNQSYQQTPTAQRPAAPAYSSSQPLQQFQRSSSQAAAANAVAYQTNNAAGTQQRTASPANVQPRPIYQAQPQYTQQQPSSGRATPTGYPSQPQTPVNGFRPPPAVAPRTSATPQPQ